MSAGPRRDKGLRQQPFIGRYNSTISPKNNDPLPKTQALEIDPLVGWFSLGRNVKRTWKGGRK